MPSELYKQMNSGREQGDPMRDTFIGFMGQMRGQNSTQMVQHLLSSGQMTQQQYNILQQKKREIEGQLSGLKSMFGF